MPQQPPTFLSPKLNDRMMLAAMAVLEVDSGNGQVAQEAVKVLGDYLGLTVLAVEPHPVLYQNSIRPYIQCFQRL